MVDFISTTGTTNSATTTGNGTVNQLIWTEWNTAYTNVVTAASTTVTNTATTAALITNEILWHAWNAHYTVTNIPANTTTATTITTSSATNLATWHVWNDTYTRNTFTNRPMRLREPTQEELQARLRQEREHRERVEIQLVEERAAREKAELLLEQHLNEMQIRDLRERGYFEVVSHSRDGKRRKYRIRRGQHGNVRLVDERGKETNQYCIHPSVRVPDADAMLAQKLCLESNEELFLKTANMTRLPA